MHCMHRWKLSHVFDLIPISRFLIAIIHIILILMHIDSVKEFDVHKRKVSPTTFSDQNMEKSPKIPSKNMGSSASFFTCLPNKIWAVFISLFLFWYLLIYGFDWFSPTEFSSISQDQEDPLQSISHESLSQASNAEGINDHDNVTENDPSVLEEYIQNPSINNEDDTIDIERLDKELEPVLHDFDAEDDMIDAKEKEETKEKSCAGRYIYMHDLPGKYNEDLLKNCRFLSKWSNMCLYLQNMGLGVDLGNPQRMFQSKGWFNTNQFSLEVIFHNRMKQYDCLTNDSSKAVAVFVPYYAGLDVARYLWDFNSVSVRDNGAVSLAMWLTEKKEWKSMGGMDHFLVAGRITWDFRRGVDEVSHWGNKLMLLPEFKNTTILTIESSPWHRNDFAIPYPTYFHPSSDNDIREWQNRMRRVKRRTLYCFVGGSRPNMAHSIRGEIMHQCRSRKCRLMECKNERNKCEKPSYVMKMFQSSVFCLQPPGDSFTRRSTFDEILAGCIPVFFTPASAYVQYIWNLPKDFNKYSVLIPEDGVKNKTISIESRLSRISKSKVASMREEVIKLIPNLIYADPRSHLEAFEDAFDLTVKGVLARVNTLRKEIKEGKNISFGFDEEKSWKYFAFGKVDDHEWDRFFIRTEKSSYY